MANRTKRTPEKIEQFLAGLAAGKSATAAARSIRMRRQQVYEWRKQDPDFAAAWDDAWEQGTDTLEDVAVQRAKKRSDFLLIFLLKARRPQLYREVTTQTGGTQQHLHLHGLSDEQRRAVLQLALNGAATQEFDDHDDGNAARDADTGSDGG